MRADGAKEVLHAQIPHRSSASDTTEERHVRRLAHSTHAPADWVFQLDFIHLGGVAEQVSQALQ